MEARPEGHALLDTCGPWRMQKHIHTHIHMGKHKDMRKHTHTHRRTTTKHACAKTIPPIKTDQEELLTLEVGVTSSPNPTCLALELEA